MLANEVRRIGCRPWVFALPDTKNRFSLYVSLHRLAKFIRNEIRPDYLLPFVGFHCKVIGSIWRKTGSRFSWWNQRDEGRMIFGTKTERRLIQTLPAVVSNSYEGRDFLVRKFGLSDNRVRVINNGIRIPKQRDGSNWRQRLEVGSDKLLIVMVANLTQYKDHATLLKAFAKVRDSDVGRHSHLVLAGRHGDTAEKLKALAFDLKLYDCVSMVGRIDDVDGLLSAADLVVHSSVKEGCPNAALEAMAQARPVVGTNISGMRQALGQAFANRFLAVPEDANALASIMIDVLRSPEMRKVIGLQNRQRIQSDFSIPRMTRAVLETVRQHRI